MADVAALEPNGNNAPMLYVPIGVFFALCVPLVATRFWTRLRKGGSLGVDDYTIVASLVRLQMTRGGGEFKTAKV